MLFNRRKFLKSTIATGAFLASSPMISFESWSKASAAAPVEKIFSTCNVCASSCGSWVHVKNGRIWKMEGHKDNVRSGGVLCARAHGGIQWAYDPDRLTQPLKRVGDKKFEPISWDQATTEIGDKLKAIIAEHGPQGIAFSRNRREGNWYLNRFLRALGSPTMMSHNAACNSALYAAAAMCGINTPAANRNSADYIMLIGRNYCDGIRTNESTQLMNANRRGAKIVTVDPRMSATGSMADEWVSIRPGSDLAFMLAMAHVLIKEDLYDKAFVEEFTEGFDKFAATIDEYTPEWAEGITTVSADTIRRLARELAQYAPKSFVDPSWKGAWGANYANSTESARMCYCLNAMLGNITKGGISLGATLETDIAANGDQEKHPQPPAPTVPRIDGVGIKGEFPLGVPAQGLPAVVAKKAQEEGSIKAWFFCSQNTARNFVDLEFMQKGILATDLTVCIDIYMNDTAIVSDYILPECSIFERNELVGVVSNSVHSARQCIPKVHPETKSMYEIIPMLAEKAGVGQYFQFTLEELNEARLKPLGMTAAELYKAGSIRPKTVPRELKAKQFQFFSEKAEEAGFSGVVKWIPPAIGVATVADNEFKILNAKQAYHSQTVTSNNAPLMQLTKDYDSARVWINAAKAAKLGIKDGDLLNITGQSGKVHQMRVKVTQKIHPEAMMIPGALGIKNANMKLANSVVAVNPNDLVSFQLEPHSGHSMLQEAIVTVSKA